MSELIHVGTLPPNHTPARLPLAALTRHAVCVGMTGSGKTGLCISLLEEIAQLGVPLLTIDPKGDLANLALLFPDLDPARFLPFVQPEPGSNAASAAAEVAAAWRQGLTASGRAEAELASWRSQVDVTVLTPGSEAGTPVDVVTALTRAPVGVEGEDLREIIQGNVAALLGLVGRRDAADLTDPEAILLAHLFTRAFTAGEDMPFDRLIPEVIDPPFDHVGYLGVNTFLSRDRRVDLARSINAVIANPAFAAWRTGAPLDVDAWLTRPDLGRTPVRVLYLAHLDEPQRMFFLTLLLHAVVAWSRRQPGTSSLRALVYFDEVMGYLPPHPRNPPTKAPLLTLMKQARAVGAGVMLTTQNPVDVDYKALGNAATWFVGRLLTAQDRERVEAGLSDAGLAVDLSKLLPTLAPRSFIVRTERGTSVIRSRHTLSWLRGPLTRRELITLRDTPPAVVTAASTDPTVAGVPSAPEGLPVRWLTPTGAAALGLAPATGVDGAWTAGLYLRLHARFATADHQEEREIHRWMFPLDHADAEPVATALHDAWLERVPPPHGRYNLLPPWLDDVREVRRIESRWREAAVFHETADGPEGPIPLDRNDVRVVGMALVWAYTAPAAPA